VVVTSDKGLAGPFNSNVLKKAEALSNSIRSSVIAKSEIQIATVGKKATEYFSRRGRTPLASWTGFGDFVNVSEIEPVFEAILDAFMSGRADEVSIVYTNFLSAMKQEVVVRKLLPFSEEGLEEMVSGIVPVRGRFADNANMRMDESTNTANKNSEYLFEPSPKEIFDSLLPALLKIQVFHAILEANASEHSSRMVAMRNATDNATDLIKSYTVSLNKARQAAINKELAEITGGSEALAV
jgi:F-type H+-transporting ATPase subunit gamma